MLDLESIVSALPHRYPFLMVDRILVIETNKHIIGYKNISNNEPWVQGHFPNQPLFPGALIIETMAQIGGFAFYQESKNKKEQLRGYLIKVDKMKFIGQVLPGDRLVIEGDVIASVNNMAQVKCVAKVDETIVASGVLSYAFQ